jgi:hypothetical protein
MGAGSMVPQGMQMTDWNESRGGPYTFTPSQRDRQWDLEKRRFYEDRHDHNERISKIGTCLFLIFLVLIIVL